MGKIIRIVRKQDDEEELRNSHRQIQCIVSNRRLTFEPCTTQLNRDGEVVGFHITTLDKNDNTRKLCELIVRWDDLVRAMNAIDRGQ